VTGDAEHARGLGRMDAQDLKRSARVRLVRSPVAAFLSTVVVMTFIWVAAEPNAVADVTGDGPFYLAMWSRPGEPTAPPYTYRVLTPWLVRLTGLDAFWGFALVTIVGLAVAGVLLWAVVLRDRTPRHAWLALGLFVFSPAAVYYLADDYRVEPVAFAFLAAILLLLQRERLTWAAIVCVVGLLDKEAVLFAAPIVLLQALRARVWAAVAVVLLGAPALYLVIHRTNLIAHGSGREFPYFTMGNLEAVARQQHWHLLLALLIALVVGFGPLAVAAAVGWRSASNILRLWALLLIPFLLSLIIAGDWIRMLAYAAVVFVPIAAEYEWTMAGAVLTLGATAVSAIGVQKMPGTWLQVLAGAAVIAAIFRPVAREPVGSEPRVARCEIAAAALEAAHWASRARQRGEDQCHTEGHREAGCDAPEHVGQRVHRLD
jgi:hypothetical protein